MIMMDSVITIYPYNDLGLLVRGKLIILAEAQSLCQAWHKDWASERTKKIEEDISAYRFINVPEAQIKDAIIRTYDLTQTYAQSFLDDDSDLDNSRQWTL